MKIRDSEFKWGSKTYIMGVINVTSDSFSGDGLVNDIDAMVEKAIFFENTGADIIDIGGESTRPSTCLLYTSPSPRDGLLSRMPSSA